MIKEVSLRLKLQGEIESHKTNLRTFLVKTIGYLNILIM